MTPVSIASLLLAWAPSVDKPIKNRDVEKVEHTASSFFTSLQLIFYGEKFTIPPIFLPLVEHTFSTLSAVGGVIALSVGLAGFSKMAFVIVIFSAATFFAAAITAQTQLQESLVQSAEKLTIQNERLEKEVDRLSILNDQLSKTAVSLEQTSEDLKKTNTDLLYTNQCLTTQVDRFAEENEKLSSQINRFAQENEKLSAQVSLFAEQNCVLAQEIQELSHVARMFSEENNELKSSLNQFRIELTAFSEQNALAKTLALEHEEQMKVLLEKNAAQTDLNYSLLQTVTQRIGASEEELQALLAIAKEQQTNLTKEFSSKLELLLDSSQLSQRMQDLREISSQIRDATTHWKEMQNQGKEMHSQIVEASRLLGHYEGKIQEKEALFVSLKEAHEKLVRDYAQENERFADLNELLLKILSYWKAVPRTLSGTLPRD